MAVVDLASLPNKTIGTLAGSDQILLNTGGAPADVTVDVLSEYVEDAMQPALDALGVAAAAGATAAGVVAADLAALESDLGSAATGKGDALVTTAAAPGGLWTTVRGFIAALLGPGGAALMRYLPKGANTVARTVESKLRERTSIFDYMTEAEIYAVQNAYYAPLVVGATVTDVTGPINRALAALAHNDISYTGKSNELFFPQGLYTCTGELLIKGAIAITGEGAPMSISGVRIRQITDNTSLFVARDLGNMSVYFSNVMLMSNTSTQNEDRGLFISESTVTSGNSYYFRDCWFSLPMSFAINIQSATDDVTIHGCTFDVSTSKFIRLGTTTAINVNFSIIGNTFYRGNTGGGQGAIDIYKANAGIISGNRFYNSDGSNAPYAVSIKTDQVQHVIIDGNTCWGYQKLLETQSGNVTVTNNRVFADDSGYGPTSPIVLSGVSTKSNVIVANNYLEGNSGIYGIVDATGVTVTNSVFKNNILKSIGSSAYAMKFEPQAYVSGSNIISDNINIGCANDGSSQTIAFTPFIHCGATPGVFVYSTQKGTATVIGTKLLSVQIEITIGSVTTPGSDEALILGIPFAAAEKTFGTLLCENIANPGGPTGYTQTNAVVPQSQAYVRTFYSGGNMGFNILQGPKLVAGSSIYCSFLMRI